VFQAEHPKAQSKQDRFLKQIYNHFSTYCLDCLPTRFTGLEHENNSAIEDFIPCQGLASSRSGNKKIPETDSKRQYMLF